MSLTARTCLGWARPAPLVFVSLLSAVSVLLPPAPARAAVSCAVSGCGVTGLPVVLRDDLVLETTGLENVVRDCADARAPVWIGWHGAAGPFPWTDAVADGDGLVVGFRGESGPWPVGFTVSDYRDPAAPVAAATVTGLSVRAAWLRDRALLVDAGAALVGFDLADPAAPVFTSFVPTGAATGRRCFSAVGATLYLLDASAPGEPVAALRALDVSDPRHPVDLGPVAFAGERCEALAGGDGALYGLVATNARLDLVAWTVKSPTRLRETARLSLAAGPGACGRDLARQGALLLAATGAGFVQAFDVTQPDRPVTGWQLRHDADRLAISVHAVLVHATDGVFVYERTTADRTPGVPGHRARLPEVATLAGDAPAAFAQLPGDPAVLVPLDLTDPACPRAGKPLTTGLSGPLQSVDGVGLLRANVAEMRVLDLTEPTSPVVRGRVPLPWPDSRALLVSRALVLVDHNFGLDRAIDLIDISDPDRPWRGGTLHERHALPTGGDWLVCGSGGSDHRDNPRVYKLDGAAQPALVGSLPTLLDNVNLARAAGDCIYLFGEDDHGEWWFETHQVRDLAHPVRLNAQPLGPAATTVDVHGGLLLVQGDGDCRLWDVTDPRHPQPAGALPAPGLAGAGFAHAGDLTVVSGRLLAVGPPRTPGAAATTPHHAAPDGSAAIVQLEPARPNPANGGTRVEFRLDGGLDLALSVYDVRGRQVAELTAGRFEAGPHSVDWDGRAADGSPAASGTYFVRLHGPGVEAVQSVTLVK